MQLAAAKHGIKLGTTSLEFVSALIFPLFLFPPLLFTMYVIV